MKCRSAKISLFAFNFFSLCLFSIDSLLLDALLLNRLCGGLVKGDFRGMPRHIVIMVRRAYLLVSLAPITNLLLLQLLCDPAFKLLILFLFVFVSSGFELEFF